MNIQKPNFFIRFINSLHNHIQGVVTGLFLVAVLYVASVFWFTGTSPFVVLSFLATPFNNTEAPARQYPDNPEPVMFSKRLDINQSTVAENLTPQQRMRRMVRSVVRIEVRTSGGRAYSGSGVILDNRKCLVVTNEHVIDAAGSIKVNLVQAVLDNGEEVVKTVPAVVVGHPSEEEDLAILQLASCGNMPWAYWFDGKKPLRGSAAIAIGSPRGQFWTSTVGTVSHPARFWGNRISSGFGLVQTDAAINPGNSGGGLFDETGRLVGINSMILRESNNLGYARSTAALLNYIEHLRQNGQMLARSLPFSFLDLQSFGEAYFVLVEEVRDDEKVIEGQLKPGDAIFGVNGHRILTINALKRLIWMDVDGVIDMVILREDEMLTVKVQVTNQVFASDAQITLPAT